MLQCALTCGPAKLRCSNERCGEALRGLELFRSVEKRHLRDTIIADDQDVGEVRIACSGSFAQLLYPRLLTLARDAPRLMVHLEAAPKVTVVSGVWDGHFDLGIG